MYTPVNLTPDEKGLFFSTVLDMANEYDNLTYEMRDKLRWSTGALPPAVHWDDKGWIDRWPIIEVSFTPMAAEPRLPTITSTKSLKTVTFPDIMQMDTKERDTAHPEPDSGEVQPDLITLKNYKKRTRIWINS